MNANDYRRRRSSLPAYDVPEEQAAVQAPIEAMKLVTRMRGRAGMTTYGLARDADVDFNYLKKLERGEARNPSRVVLMSLGNALTAYTSLFSRRDVDRILKAAGFPPPSRNVPATEDDRTGRGNRGEFARPAPKRKRSGFSIRSLFSRKKPATGRRGTGGRRRRR